MTTDPPEPAVPDLAVIVEAPAWDERLPQAETLCRRAVAAAIRAAGGPLGPAEVSLVLADDDRVRELNRDWRGKDKPTNVLSFPAAEPGDLAHPMAGGPPLLLGDIVVAFGVTAGEAAAEGKTLADHLSHLAVHGMLHLLGFDHETEEDAAVMEGLEAEALDSLGIANPYDEH